MLGSFIRSMSAARVGGLLLASVTAAPFVAQAQTIPFIQSSGVLQPSPAELPGGQLFGTYFDADDGRAVVALSAGPGPGRVFSYKRGPNGEWLDDGPIPNPNPTANDAFGTGVAVEGKLALVRTTDGGYELFERTNAGWVGVQHIDSTEALSFNNQVDFENGIAAIGATSSTSGGSVALYRLQRGRLTLTEVVHASDATPNDSFGYRLDLSPSGRTLLVGAGAQATEWSGSAYVFHRLGWRWLEPQKLANGVTNSVFGEGVAATDDLLVIGASAEADGHGAAYVYRKGLLQPWQLTQRLTAPPVGYEAFGFGNDVAIGAGRVVIGAHFTAPGGLAFGYRECPEGLCTQWAAQDDAFFGESIAIDRRQALISSPVEASVNLYELPD